MMAQRLSSFEDLRVYQLAFELQQEIFTISKSFPLEERYSLTDQLRRSSRSIGANISEAWQKRAYVAHFASKLSDADAEQAETRHWLKTAKLCGYMADDGYSALAEKCKSIGRMLGAMIAAPEKFCPRPRSPLCRP
jgi:four helix bundle protein